MAVNTTNSLSAQSATPPHSAFLECPPRVRRLPKPVERLPVYENLQL